MNGNKSVTAYFIENTGVLEKETVTDFNLNQNYPNPFNPATTISYSLCKPCQVKIKIYDLKGRVVRTLINKKQGAGIHELTWDTIDGEGNRVPSGIYICRMRAGKIIMQHKMLYTK
ncbi:MAG: FlgD immunoglobulin-like domain containing protein [bacterium]